MTFNLILILIFCLVGLVPGYLEYTRKWTPSIKSKYSWIYSWTGNALLMGSIAILLKILKFDIGVIDLVAGTTIFVSGFGFLCLVMELLVIGKLLHVEKGKIISHLFRGIGITIYFIYHFIMGFLGIWLIFIATPTVSDVFLAIVILILYATFMIPKGLEVPWILNRKKDRSIIPLKIRRRVISWFIIFLFILLPFLALLV